MAQIHSERLSGLDSSFLLLESDNVPTHVGSTLIFESGPLRLEGGGVDFEAIAKAYGAVVASFPRYRQVLRFTPVTGQPVWVDDDRFELAYHLRHTSLPRPGTDAQLQRLAARIMESHLDRARPLWETWIVEGLEGDRFALITKVHHCMVDGLAGVELMQRLLSPDPDAAPPSAPPVPEVRPEPPPSVLLREDLARRARRPLEAARDLTGLLRGSDHPGQEIASRARGALATLGATLIGPSETPLNRPVGPHRRIAWWTTELAALREIRNALGGTVNDVVLATAAGAFRRFLSGRGVDLRDLDFRALAPVNMRRPEEGECIGNRVAAWVLELPISDHDPRRRLRRIAARTASLKTSRQALGAELLTDLVDWTPTRLLSLAARGAARVLPFNTIVTNVPGPRSPLYLLGAPLVAAYPHVLLVDHVDLAIALVSYAGRLYWGINADYDAVPDIDEFVRALERSFAELREAAGVTDSEG